MNEVVKASWCNVKANKEFIFVATLSGYRAYRADPKGVEHLLPPDADNEVLGAAVLNALAHSRFVLPEPRKDVFLHPDVTFDKDLYDYESSNRRYAAWIANLIEIYGYKTKRTLFNDMKNCSVESMDGFITMRPSHHDKLEGWSGDGISEEDYVMVTANSMPEEVGYALRLALSRCT